MTFHPVSKPLHYNKGGIECLAAIEASMSFDEFMGYLKGNILKYLWRWRDKGGTQDLEKALSYLSRMIDRAAKNEEAKKEPYTAKPVAPIPPTYSPKPLDLLIRSIGTAPTSPSGYNL